MSSTAGGGQKSFAIHVAAHLHQAFFTLLLTAFVAALLIDAIDLQPAPQLMPLLVGIPTLLLLLVQLLKETLMHRWAGRAEEDDLMTQAVLADVKRTTSVSEITLDDDDTTEPPNPRLILVFALWTIAFVLIAMYVSFRVAVPLGLLVILWHASRSWKVTLLSTIGVTAVLWLAFEYFLGIRF